MTSQMCSRNGKEGFVECVKEDIYYLCIPKGHQSMPDCCWVSSIKIYWDAGNILTVSKINLLISLFFKPICLQEPGCMIA